MTMRRLLLLAGLAVALMWTAQAPARPACTAGVHATGGVTSRTFCGPAHATLHLGGKTYVFTQGECARTGSTFTINIGTITLPPGSPKHRYFGITVFTGRDGTFTNQAVALQFPGGKRLSLFHAKIVLKAGRSQGTFSGTTLADQIPGSGTFRCS
jgi:hypothetical protein